MKMIIDEFIFGNTKLQPYIDNYIKAQAVLQTVSNPSGTFLPEGLGLGEPKFQVDGTRFNGAWGRPQRDGPALRAIALISYSKYLIGCGQSKQVKTVIWPIISNDLSYVGQYWNQTGFDLWEEVLGSSYFTIQNQARSLAEGTLLAQTLNVECAGCDQAPEILCFLQSFWNGKYIVSNINENNGRTGIDGNSILGPISIFDIDAYCDSPTMQPCNSQNLANFKVLIDTMRAIYTINSGTPVGQGVAVGRYPEDTYQGGNPWCKFSEINQAQKHKTDLTRSYHHRSSRIPLRLRCPVESPPQYYHRRNLSPLLRRSRSSPPTRSTQQWQR
jgi:glucoamylase